MSIVFPVHRPEPTFSPGSTIAGHFISKDVIHLLHIRHRTLGLYELDRNGQLTKRQEFLTKGTTSLHLVAAKTEGLMDAFVMIGELVDWYSVQGKGANTLHDFVRLESKEQLMQFCRTVPYTFVQLDADTQMLVETRRFYFAEDRSPTILTQNLPDGKKFCIVGTSNGLMGVLSTRTHEHDKYYKVGGGQNTTYKYSSLFGNTIVVEVVSNGQCCFYFLNLDSSGSLTLLSTHKPRSLPLGVGPLPSSHDNLTTACVWYSDRVEFVDATCSVGPQCLGALKLPLPLHAVRHAAHLSECDVEAYLTDSHLIRIRGVDKLEIVETCMLGAEIGGGGLYSHHDDLVRLKKYTDVSSVGWTVHSNSGVQRTEFPYAYEFATISSRGCESSKKELNSWTHCFDRTLGSSFLTTKDGATYAVCRKSGLCADRIEEVIQLWQYDGGIIASTQSATIAFDYEGTPRLSLTPRPLWNLMDSERTFAFKDGTQVTGTHINCIQAGKSFLIPESCQPVIDATCVDESLVYVASSFSTYALSMGQVLSKETFEEPVLKVIAADGIVATMTLQTVHIEGREGTKLVRFEDRLSDVVIANSCVVCSTFDGSVYLGSHQIANVRVDCIPIKLVVAGHKVLAVSEIDAIMVDTLTSAYDSAPALSGVNGGFSWDDDNFAVLKNGNMWVCDLNAIGLNVQRASQMFIGPIKISEQQASQWSWCEKLSCTNAITSVRFNHEITDVCPVHPQQQTYLQSFEGYIGSIKSKAYISSFETLYLWADFSDSSLFKKLCNIQKRLETHEHTFGGHESPKWLEWMGFIDGELLGVALQNANLDWLFEEEGINAEELRATLRLVSY